jgi:hypothetical protein
LPHIILTSDGTWDPSSLEDEFSIADLIPDAPQALGDQDPRVNIFGEYTGSIDEDIDLIIHHCNLEHEDRETPGLLGHCINQRSASKAKSNLEILRPNFGWLPLDHIKKTIQATTQFARAAHWYPFRKHYKTRWPAANVT